MKFKNILAISAIFIIFIIGFNGCNAASDNTTEIIESQNDFTDISFEEYSILNSQEKDVPDESLINQDESEFRQDSASKNDIGDSKLNLEVISEKNFIKNKDSYDMYLIDSDGNAIPNKELVIKFDDKTYKKTTDDSGKFSITIQSSKSPVSLDISYIGDEQYQTFSEVHTVYIENSLSITIGNAKLLTNGYLRVYLNGPKNLISKKTIKIHVGNKEFVTKTTAEGFVVIKPEVPAGKYTITVEYNNYNISKTISCINGDVINPLKKFVPTVNGIPDIDMMPANYVMGNTNAQYTLKKSQYLETIKRDSHCLFLHGKLSKYTFFKTKDCPDTYHILKRETWNVIERAINTKLVKKNKYKYWPKSITVSLNGKSFTYCEVRDIQNTGYTCGPTSASVCSQVLKKYYSEKYFQKKAHVTNGANIPVLKKALNKKFKTYYFHEDSLNSAIKQLAKGSAIIAYLPNHYISIIDISKDGKKILVSNSYGSYNKGSGKVPTKWVSVKYFKTKFAGVGLVVKLKYKLTNNKKQEVKNYYNSMGTNWNRQNTNERVPNIGL